MSEQPLYWGLKIAEWLTIFAIVIGPLLGVWLAEYLAKHKSQTERKHAIFRALWASRIGGMSHASTEALNLIPYEFQKNATVINTWRAYLATVNQRSINPEENARLSSLIAPAYNELLFSIVEVLKIDIQQRDVLQGTYLPQGIADKHEQEEQMRKSFIEFFAGTKPVSVKIITEGQN